MDHNSLNDFCCVGQIADALPRPQPREVEQNRPGRLPPAAMADRERMRNLEDQEPSESLPMPSLEALAGVKDFNSHLKYFKEEFQKEQLNATGMRAFYRLAELVQAETARIEALLRDNPGTSDDSYHYPDSRISIMFEGRTALSATTIEGSPGDDRVSAAARDPTRSPTARGSMRLRPSMRPRRGQREQWDSAVLSPTLQPISVAESDELKQMVDTVIIEKKGSAYEVDVYESRAVMQSALFPRLLDFKYDDRTDLVSLKLEKLVPMREFNLTLSHLLETSAKAQFMLSKLLLDIMGALRILHLTGFVHCDVSPNNIGFNLRTGTWQLFDFDRALPIEVAQTEPHRGGTRGFRSRRYEQTGLFRPWDDYISLVLTFCEGFICWDRLVPAAFGEFPLVFADQTDPSTIDIGIYYRKAFDLFCRNWEANNAAPIENDESFKQALINM